ncbi:MAG: RAMP superfamily CRISPR-associated protein [Thiobacillus sp.]|nr:RAMP superfamily CRISPR-associated protein [Thiobacillus sp.]
MNQRTLLVEFHELWHVGSGRGRGTHLDAVVDRDESGLPYVPGRMLKGVLREAAERVANWCPAAPAHAATLTQLFGARPGDRSGEAPLEACAPGTLHVSDARLPAEVAKWLASEAGERYRERLFREHFSTAIDHETGTARESSLRGIEVAVPMTLEAEIRVAPLDSAEGGFELLARALPLVRALGAHRTRGLGRVSLAFKDEA